MSSADFLNRKFAYACACKEDKHSIKLGTLFNSHDIIVSTEGQKHRLSKSEVYGFRGCDKKTYRFYHDNEYRIVSTLKIYIYYRDAESGTGKSASTEEHFFFSVSLDSDVIGLTTDNLKAAYPDNEKFHKLLDSSFRSESELSTFDKYLKKYKLVLIYDESTK
jgi:hypothetical protein